jgi:transposase
MSLHPADEMAIAEETVRVARAAFPKGSVYMRMRDALGPIYTDAAFASLFARRGQPAESPARLALVTIMQFAEGLSDRQAADAVRSRIDWKYALGLELTDPGFDASILSEFRSRLVTGDAAHLLFERMLEQVREWGLLKPRGRARTDSTHILAAIRTLNRLECVGETLRHALNTVATVAPDWLRSWAPSARYDRYGRRFEEYRLPSGKAERYALAEQIAADGRALLSALDGPDAPDWLRRVPAVETLRQVWEQQFVVRAGPPTDQPIQPNQPNHSGAPDTPGPPGKLAWRTAEELPPSTVLIRSPYDVEARYAKKRQTEWTGYKVHLTETCDDEFPSLIINVETTPATTTDYEVTPLVQRHLAEHNRLPSEHLVDTGYMSAVHLLSSAEQGIDLVGPVALEKSWQAQAKGGFDSSAFVIDWQAQQARCPQGHLSQKWQARDGPQGRVVHFKFSRTACGACPVRAHCTQSATLPRALTIYAQPAFEALQAARKRQQEEAFWQRYARRAGIEGTLAQGNARADLRRARFVGLAKTHLQHLCTALGLNVLRLGAWLAEVKPHTTRLSPFAALAPAAA